MVRCGKRLASDLSGLLVGSLLTLNACSGAGGGSSPLPAQPPLQQQKPGQPPPPASVGTTSSVKIYATAGGTIAVFDEDGNPIAGCAFPNLHGAYKLAFDSHNDHLYVTNLGSPGPVRVYDLQGNPIQTTGSFSGAFPIIAFDSNNDRLYTVSENSFQHPGLAVFDEAGNAIPINGTYATNGAPFDVAFDPFNHRFYVADANNGVIVFDELGNLVAPFSSFPGAGAITFDTHNRLFYIGTAPNAIGAPNVLAFDESGNAVPLTGTFPNLGGVEAITFDAHNNRLYAEPDGGGVNAYDEEGNQILLSGKFPGVLGPGLIAAPQ